MKTTSDRTPKPQKKRRSVGMRKKSTAAYSAYIYKIEKVNAVFAVDFLVSLLNCRLNASISFLNYFWIFTLVQHNGYSLCDAPVT